MECGPSFCGLLRIPELWDTNLKNALCLSCNKMEIPKFIWFCYWKIFEFCFFKANSFKVWCFSRNSILFHKKLKTTSNFWESQKEGPLTQGTWPLGKAVVDKYTGKSVRRVLEATLKTSGMQITPIIVQQTR